MNPLSVGVIGLGAIGSRLVKILTCEFSRQARVDFACDLKREKVRWIQKTWAPSAKFLCWQDLVDRADLVIEAASQRAALPIAKRALQKNKQVLILSVGGLLEWDGLSLVLDQTKGKLWIPSGALAGVDALLAASEGFIHQITLTSRKPLASLAGAPYLRQKKIRLSQIRKKLLIFEGDAVEANRAFPRNVNVAATLALAAGVSPRETRVRIFTSPNYRMNQHEVDIVGDFGSIRTVVENIPSAVNPRTSELAVLSAKATLKKIFGHLHIGT